jgi:radical SAM protein with 4Fe4S-binding SPASM domain
MAGMTSMLRRVKTRAELIGRLTETWLRRPDTPNRLVLDVTRRCNLRCSMCRTWEDPRRDELSVDEIAGLIRQLPRLTWLDVTGGEVFVRKDALELLTTIATTGKALTILHFPTNGWFTERVVEACQAIVEARPDLQLIVTVSIDGPPEVHDRIRGRVGSFERAFATLARLRALAGVDVYVGTTLTSESEATLDELSDLLTQRLPDFQAREWHINRLQRSAHFFNNADIEDDREPSPPADGLAKQHLARRGPPRSLVDAMELAYLINLEFHQRGEPSGITCEALRSTAFVSPEGDVFPCHVWNRPIGNLRQHSLAELWHARETLELRGAVERLECGGCFTPCEAYPALAGNPIQTLRQTAKRSLRLLVLR